MRLHVKLDVSDAVLVKVMALLAFILKCPVFHHDVAPTSAAFWFF